MNVNLYTTYDTLTVPESPAATEQETTAEQPLDFEALAYDFMLLLKTTTKADWYSDAHDAAERRVAEAGPRLIDAAERCQEAERRASNAEANYKQIWDALAHEQESYRESLDSYVAAHVRLRGTILEQAAKVASTLLANKELGAERDRLKEQLTYEAALREAAEKRVEEIRGPARGLSEEEKKYIDDVLRIFVPSETRGKFRGIIDRLVRQRVLPWITVVDGKRPDGMSDEENIFGVYECWDGPTSGVGVGCAVRWRFKDVRFCIRISDLLATLPEEE